MPYLTDVEALVDAITPAKPGYVLVDKLRLKDGVLNNVMGFIGEFYPQLKEEYSEIFCGNEDFYKGFFRNIKKKCDKNGLKCGISELPP